uniref:OTU domain-containing protein n=1 Tax=Ditylenchus dipsaci TaxID=166011 RepID=A0A915CN31_9BILA
MESNKGKPMASYNGYLMQQTAKSANGTKQFWRCATRRCHGTAESIFGKMTGLIERKSHDGCIQSPMAVTIKKKMTATKRLAVENLAASSQSILSAGKKGSSTYEIECMPKDSDIKRMINNARKPKGASEVDKILREMTLSTDFSTTIRGERFLLWDSRVVDLKKPVILLFASSFGLQLLEKYKRWSMDGTFYSAPKGFKQLYTVNVFKEESTLPCLFMLLPNKSEESYSRAFEAVFRKYPMLRPKALMAASTGKSNEKVVSIRCFEFLPFPSWPKPLQKLVEWKLRPLYADAEVKALVRSLTALACLPVSEVEKGFDGLVAAINEKISSGNIAEEFVSNIKEYLGYIESTYVRRFNKEREPIDALYPIEVWNCYDLLLKKNPRTDNAHEGWHFRFNMRFPKAHMSLSQFILRLQDEEEETWQLEIRHEANPADPLRNQRKKTFERNEEQLQALVEAYSKVDPPLRDQVSFIRHIQLHLAKFELFVEVEDSVDAEEILFVKELNSGSIVQEKSNDKLPSFFKGIEADGNCLYRSLAEAVYGEEDRHAQVRMEMMQYLLDNGEKPFARFFTAIGDKSATVEEYAAHFNQPSNEPARWGRLNNCFWPPNSMTKI